MGALRITLVAGLSGCAAISAGCSNRKAVAQASRDLAAEISRSSTPQFTAASSEQAQEQRVYIDASISMKGFVNPTRHTVFDDFIEFIGDAMPGCHLYKYGEMGGPAPGNNQNASRLITEPVGFGLELHRPDFYSLSFNPDDVLINRLVNDERPALSVVVTDGVYSEPQGATSPPVVQGIQEWLDKGRVFGIFILKSVFNGPFYSERGRTMLPKLSVPSRPFYAFVFSPTETSLRELQEKLKQRFPDMQSLVFADSAVSCVPVLNGSLKDTYSYRKPPQVEYYWHMFDSGLFARHNPAPVGYGVKCSTAVDYPISDFKLELATKYYRWGKGKFQEADGVPPGFKHDLQSGKDSDGSGGTDAKSSDPTPDLVVYFPQDPGSDYGFYYFRLTASPKGLRPEITELSTRDDRQQKDADKAYRFYELISSLSEEHFKSRLAGKTSPSIFVTIQNH